MLEIIGLILVVVPEPNLKLNMRKLKNATWLRYNGQEKRERLWRRELLPNEKRTLIEYVSIGEV